MVESVGSIVSGVMADVARPTARSSVPSFSLQEETSVPAGTLSAVQSVSPRMHSDPTSGVLVVEFLSSEGKVKMQFPSEAAMAYLRSGLTEKGQPETMESNETSVVA